MKIGRISENVLKRSVLQQIRTRRDEVIGGAGIGRDCAIYSVSLESGAEGSFLNKNDINVVNCVREGFLERGIAPVLQRCVNRLAARGAEPIAASVSLLLPAEEREEWLKALMAEAEGFCQALRVQIAEAGGRVSDAVLRPYGTVHLYGVLRIFRGTAAGGDRDTNGVPESDFHTVRSARPGQDIVVSKWIGLEGTAILAERHRESLLARYPVWLVEEAAGFGRYLSTVPEANAAILAGACAIHNVSEGGIFAGLWELAEGAGAGLTVDLRKLPLRQETVEVCNHCNVNPYELLSEGCLLMTCESGDALVSALEAAGVPAVVVGQVTDSRDRLLLNEDEVRYLDRPHVDAVYRDAEKATDANQAEGLFS